MLKSVLANASRSVRILAAAHGAILLLSYSLITGVHAQTLQEAPAESSEMRDAFSRLDELAEEIANRRWTLASPAVPAPAPVSAPSPTPAPAQPPAGDSDGTDAAGSPAEHASCRSREDTVLGMAEMDESYREFSQAILTVNDVLPTFRNNLRDIDQACAAPTVNGIASAIKKLQRLDIEAATEVVVSLVSCVDDLRRRTDREFNAPDITTIRMQRLSDELQRLTEMTHRVQDLERALRRAASKQNRLVEELAQLDQEIRISCR